MRLGVIGVGHVGLVTGVCFAELGHEVIAADKDARKIKLLSDGIATVYEPGVEELLQKALSANHLRFTTDPQEVVDDAEIIFICVGTPPRADGSADLSQVEEAARTVAEVLSSYRLLVEKSTVPVKTAQWIERTIRLYSKDGVEFDVASNPEFLREGRAVQDFMHPDRIVIGANSDRAKSLLLALYEGFDCPKIVTDVNTAELIKHASNSFLALKISFINMIADLCERAGTDIEVLERHRTFSLLATHFRKSYLSTHFD
ncbi:MAG TPA: UDP-glucose/GDP-mannose dehydrogenase family protein, partial [Armatimonadetes bacterium]|nr:UDP-glucose/GDP-mannose dehydrogenase family protein [Armatimonadota bacterium]